MAFGGRGGLGASGCPDPVTQVCTEPEPWDAAVIGAGPSGSAAAIGLASVGWKVVLIERASFPREKICGDGLTGRTIAALERLGVLNDVEARAHKVRSAVVWSASGIPVELSGSYLTLRRIELDAILARRAAEVGAKLITAEVRGINPSDGRTFKIWLLGRQLPISARSVVIATGARVGLVRRLGLIKDARPSAIAGRCYVRSCGAEDILMARHIPGALPSYGWIFPLGRGLFNVGCACFLRAGTHPPMPLREAFKYFISCFPPAAELMRRAEYIGPFKSWPLRCGLSGVRPLGPGMVLVSGETLGSTNPLSGEGVALAMETGELAACALDAALRGGPKALKAYTSGLRRLHREHKFYSLMRKLLARRTINDFIMVHLNRHATLRAAVSSMFEGR